MDDLGGFPIENYLRHPAVETARKTVENSMVEAAGCASTNVYKMGPKA